MALLRFTPTRGHHMLVSIRVAGCKLLGLVKHCSPDDANKECSLVVSPVISAKNALVRFASD